MEDTLVEIIKKLHGFDELGEYINEDLNSKGELKDHTKKILRKFYQENPLAYDVASGKESYVKLIEPIEKKFKGFWKKVCVPKIDETFDNEVRRVIKSMNHVGVEYINPENFTTDRKRRQNRRILLISAGAGLFTASLPKLIEWSSTTGYNNPGNLFVPIIAAGVMYIGCNLSEYFDINLQYLQESAQKTDELLTQYYIKPPSS